MNIIVSIFSLVGVLVVLFLIFAYGFACGYDYYKKQTHNVKMVKPTQDKED